MAQESPRSVMKSSGNPARCFWVGMDWAQKARALGAAPNVSAVSAKKPRLRLRKLSLTVHLYIGLLAGAVFVLVGLTGSILAFGGEIDAWLNADLMTVEAPSGSAAKYRPLDEILATAKAAIPPGGALRPYVRFPVNPESCFGLVYAVPAGRDKTEIYQIFVNPYTAAVNGRRLLRGANPLAQPLMNVIATLHYTLLLGDSGSTAVGFLAIFLVASLATGVILWWPAPWAWRHALTIKWGATKERVIFDLHRTVGASTCAVLIIMLFSGIYMIFKPQVRAFVEFFSPVHLNLFPPDLKSERLAETPPLGPDVIVAIVDAAALGGDMISMQLPDGKDGVYVVGKRALDEVNHADAQRRLVIDQYSGKILHFQDPHKFTRGETFLEWQYPLHSGEAFGTIGRAFVLVLGFVPLILYVTGVTRWLQKRRARADMTRRAG